MSPVSIALFTLVASTFRSRAALQAEIAALRHQIAVLAGEPSPHSVAVRVSLRPRAKTREARLHAQYADPPAHGRTSSQTYASTSARLSLEAPRHIAVMSLLCGEKFRASRSSSRWQSGRPSHAGRTCQQ